MEDRDLHPGLELLLDLEALRALDVLEIDAAEGRLQRRDDLHEFGDVLLLDLDVEAVDTGEFLEQDRLAFHHRLRGQRADVAEAEHGGAVGDDGDEVLAGGEFGRFRRIVDDRLAGGGDAGRVGESQVALVAERLRRLDLELTGARLPVIDEGARAQIGGERAFHGARVPAVRRMLVARKAPCRQAVARRPGALLTRKDMLPGTRFSRAFDLQRSSARGAGPSGLESLWQVIESA